MSAKIQIHFLGAAGTVTGSKYLVVAAGTKLLVDCGMFQGIKQLRQLNWDYPPVDVHALDGVILTHGHLDHVGYLPRLVSAGYHGPVIGTLPTLDIATIILRDSAMIQEEDARRANREGYSKHHPAKPLYTLRDVEHTLPLFRGQPLGEWIDFNPHIRYRFQYNGHILGATFVELEVLGKRIVFSGDVGRNGDLLLRDPKRPERADILFLESTYGDRLHPTASAHDRLAQLIAETHAIGGTLIIPSFAVERAQLLMYMLWQLHRQGRLPDQPMYLDSPMGANVLGLFDRFPDWHKLSHADTQSMCGLFHVVRSVEENEAVKGNRMPKLVIAGSGMVSGGRVLGYLQDYIGDPNTTVLLVGYQAEGTRGRDLYEGVQELKLYGQNYPVRARIEELTGLSGHADQAGLVEWAGLLKPEHVFLVHGELQAADALRVRLAEAYGWSARVPALYEIVEIEA